MNFSTTGVIYFECVTKLSVPPLTTSLWLMKTDFILTANAFFCTHSFAMNQKSYQPQ